MQFPYPRSPGQIPVVDHSLRLADKTFDGLRSNQIDPDTDADDRLDLTVDGVAKALHFRHLIGKTVRNDLDMNRHFIQCPWSAHFDLIMRRGTFDAEQRFFNLRRKKRLRHVGSAYRRSVLKVVPSGHRFVHIHTDCDPRRPYHGCDNAGSAWPLCRNW